jgi:hypothetical protein
MLLSTLDMQESYNVGAVEIGHHVLAVVAAVWSSLLAVLPSPVWIMIVPSEALYFVLHQ